MPKDEEDDFDEGEDSEFLDDDDLDDDLDDGDGDESWDSDDDDDPGADSYGDRDDDDANDFEEHIALDDDSDEEAWVKSLDGNVGDDEDDDDEEESDDDDDDDEFEYDYSSFDDDGVPELSAPDDGLGSSSRSSSTAAGDLTGQRSGESVDLGNEFCRGAGQPMGQAIDFREQFFLDAGGYHCYLLLARKPANVKQLIAVLREASYRPSIAGSSRRPATNGRQYEFYVRIGNSKGGAARMARVLQGAGIVSGSLLGLFEDGDEGLARAERSSRLESSRLATHAAALHAATAERDMAKREVAVLRARIAILERDVASMREALSEARLALESARSAAAVLESDRVAVLKQRLDQAKTVEELRTVAAKSAAMVSGLQEKLGVMQEALAKAEQAREIAERGYIEVDDLRRKLIDELSELGYKIAGLEEARRALEEELLEVRWSGKYDCSPSSASPDRIVAIRVVCSSLRFKRSSYAIVERECSDFLPLFGKLFDLQKQKRTAKCTSVQSAKGWMEDRFSTGSDDDGRLYFKIVGEYIDVLISRKRDQKRDMDWMKRN